MTRFQALGAFAVKVSTVLVGPARPSSFPNPQQQSIRTLASMVKAQRFVYAKRFVGEPKETDFTLETEELAPIKDGGK